MSSDTDKRVHVYWKLLGGHIHMRVFINGASMGNLVCREEEFNRVRSCFNGCVLVDSPSSGNETTN